MRLLLAEDEPELSRALVKILEHAHYTVDAVSDGRDALDYALTDTYDGILLDIMMPGLEGTEVLRRLRAEGIETPVLFTTAKGEIEDRIEGLDLGADDYLVKPFDMGELLARIRAMVRRRAEHITQDPVCGNLTLSRTQYTLSTPDGGETRLSGKEYQMMELLMKSPGQVISSALFMERIWADADTDDSVIWVNISNLRKKLASIGADAEIQAKRGVGYFIRAKE